MALGKFANRIVGSGEESLDQIQFNPRNWRVHPLNQQNALKGVLEEVGWVQEVIVNKRTGNLIDGHLRCQLAAREGAKTIPVKYVDLSEDEEALVLSTLDPIAAMAVTDKQKLDDLFASIETENADVLKMLDDIAEKERLEYGKKEVDAEPQIDRAAELNEKWQVVTGNLWQIGEHRLLCGDSTKREDVERVMDIPLNLCVTDPPYGVEYDANWRNDAAEKRLLSYAARRVGQVENDSNDDWRSAWELFTGDVLYCWHAGLRASNTQMALESVGFEVRAQIIWTKPHFVIGRGHYTPRHEPCWYCVRKGKQASWIGEKLQDTVWHVSLDRNTEGGHSTQKPLECMARPIRNHEGDVYEPFAGSGTTMVACQNLNRKCRAIEISPNYCAVILERMSTAFPELEIKRLA